MKRIIFYILAAFIIATIFLVYIQYNSSKNINTIIEGNEKLLAEYHVNSDLKKLERDIVVVESNVKNIVSINNASHVENLRAEIENVQADLRQLQKISDDDRTVKSIDELDQLVQVKLNFNKQVLDSFYSSGKNTAEHLIASMQGKLLTDSILQLAQKIESGRHVLLTGFIVSNDSSGKKAQKFNNSLIALVLICGACLFWYIINTIRRQIELIQRLDISEKKVREGAYIKEKFLANMSHEIRTPMNAIMGFTNLLQHKEMDEEGREYVQTIQKSGENLLTIINDILDLSKIEAGMMRIELAPFSIRGLIHSIETMFKTKAAEKNILLTVSVHEAIPDDLEGDATRLTQILVNLIGNALKFTNAGMVSINITDEGRMGGFVHVGITITDTGIGIEKEKLAFVFDRFQQAEDSVTRKFGGTGLGLSIVNDLVILQNGSIKVESEPGVGTTFRLGLPYKISVHKIDPSPQKKAGIIKHNFEAVSVLVVEDNEINQKLIKHLFKNWQLSFELAHNGREAIEKIHSKKYDLVLMDIQMPEMDGYTATQKIRTELKSTIPIIAMTAHALAGEKEKCLSYGMNEYISKPIRETELQQLISRFTQKNTSDEINVNAVSTFNPDRYKYIDLTYLDDVSAGDAGFKKMVTSQFIESIPLDLRSMEKAWENKEIAGLRLLVHDMKSTVSVMGLNNLLNPYFSSIEFELQDPPTFAANFKAIHAICSNAVAEAAVYLKKL